MKDLLAKEQFTDAILDGDARSLKQSWPHSLWAALTLAMELESYRLASSQEKFPVRGMYCGVYCPIPHRCKWLSPYSKFNAQGFVENSCQPFWIYWLRADVNSYEALCYICSIRHRWSERSLQLPRFAYCLDQKLLIGPLSSLPLLAQIVL